MTRVRFAPSPTGFLHIGGVRTALFNYLYARAQGGQYLLRIEDTDRERSEKKYEDEILSSLSWLGIAGDEPPIRQSERLERYREVAAGLLSDGLAYEEERDGKTAVRLRIPHTEIVLYDLVHGETRFDTSLFDDLVLIKSDGYPAYHFACVVDDHDMEISHVIRGDDHLSNTPRQLLIYEALGWKPPKYAHLPLILGEDGSPLSKRHGAVALSAFRAQGYLHEGILNYLALLGWTGAGNEELFTLEDLTRRFSLKKVNKSSARFDYEKLGWINMQHIKKLGQEDFLERLRGFLGDQADCFPQAAWPLLAPLYKTRLRTWKDLLTDHPYLFGGEPEYDLKQAGVWLEKPGTLEALDVWGATVEVMEPFESCDELEAATRETASRHDLKAGDLIHPLRYALTGQTSSPGIFELMCLLGQRKCRDRVKKMLSDYSNR